MKWECHQKFSNGQKCVYKTKFSTNYRKHVERAHTPVPCPRCPEIGDFEDSLALRIHQKTHSVRHYCPTPWCQSHFQSEEKRDLHLMSCKIPKDRIKCSLCKETFSTKECYRRHLIKMHGKSIDKARAILAAEAPPMESELVKEVEHEVLEPPLSKTLKSLETGTQLKEFKIADVSGMNDRIMLKYGLLTILYDYKIRGPRIAHIILQKSNCDTANKRIIGRCRVDHNVPMQWRNTYGDFVQVKGRDIVERGHLQAKRHLQDEESWNAAPLLSTMLPQFKNLNRGVWSLVEDFEDFLLSEDYAEEFVKIDSFAGGLYVKDNGKCGRLPIASHFFKIIICHLSSGEIDVWILVIEHKTFPNGMGLNMFLKTYQELLAMDTDNFIPRLDLSNTRNLNKDIWSEAASSSPNMSVFAQPLLPPPPSTSLKSATHSSSSSSSTTHTSSVDRKKVLTVKKQNCNAFLSSLNYQPPKNAASFADPRYNFEVLKNGTIVDSVKFSPHENKGYYIIGRVPGCDIVTENLSVSKAHAILQFVQSSGKKDGDKKSEDLLDEPEETGLYLYDLKSTNGTFINKNQVLPQKFYRVYVGCVLEFGTYTIYIANGPSADADEESDKSVTELLNEKVVKDLERRRLEEEAQLKRATSTSKLPKETIEVEGIDWGMGEDADEESDMRVNPFAKDYDASELTLDNPKKTLKSWFEREGHNLEYEVGEQENGQYICRIGLPLDRPTDAPVYAESEVKGKKKEAAHDAAIKACQILDSHGLLRSSTQESRKRKAKRLEEDDYYSSDDDTFLNPTGSVEKKREKRMRLAGKIEKNV